MQSLNGLDLERVPAQPKQPLRAWDAADEYVLEHLAELGLDAGEGTSMALVNDAFGTLTCSLRSFDPTVFNESAAGAAAIAQNLAHNALDPVAVHSMLDLGEESALGQFDVVVIKVPKANAQLVELLHRLRPHLGPDTMVLGAAMSKHIHTSTLEIFEQLMGPTTTSLAKKKARLIHVDVDLGIDGGPNPWPNQWSAHGFSLANHGGGFSPDSLDAGTQFLLEAGRFDRFAEGVDAVRMVDLGCGNGVVGLVAAKKLGGADVRVHIDAVDDSALAIAAANASWGPHSSLAEVQFHHTHRMVEALDPASADLVVVNPPFHEDRVVSDHVAWSMFVDAHKVLRPGRSLVVVGNRHLAYHAKLKKIFGNADELATNKRFVVHESIR